jgi:fructoselysine-6-P-deglycase FrlB-like protein
MDVIGFDPTQPLAGPPDPWASTDQPSSRGGPPFHITDMIAVEPFLAERIAARSADPAGPAAALAALVRDTLRAGAPVVLTGCGTSEHAAIAIGGILREATGATSIWSQQALELSLDPPTFGLVIGISHEGGTAATNAALRAACDAGARTAIITVSDRSPGAALADLVVTTDELDQSWCHTVGYLSPIVAATAVAGHLTGASPEPAAVGGLVGVGLLGEPIARALEIAQALADSERWLVLASGADRAAARELTLKVEEGAWMPAAYRHVETFLHGHLAATDPATAIVAIATDRRRHVERARRLRGALAAARTVGMRTTAIVSQAYDVALPPESTSVGRIVVDDASPAWLASAAAVLSSATALQTLTERLARARGVDPDAIHRDVDAYRTAAEAAEASD